MPIQRFAKLILICVSLARLVHPRIAVRWLSDFRLQASGSSQRQSPKVVDIVLG
jgi:hypothetical protein